MKTAMKELHPSESAVGTHMDEMTDLHKQRVEREFFGSKEEVMKKSRETKMDRITEEAMHLDQ